MGRFRIGLISGKGGAERARGYVVGGLMKIRFRRRAQDTQRTAYWSLVLTDLYIHTPVCGKEKNMASERRKYTHLLRWNTINVKCYYKRIFHLQYILDTV